MLTRKTKPGGVIIPPGGPEMAMPISPKNETERAFNRIINYCDKHSACSEGCLFYDPEKLVCFFESKGPETPPCDWEKK